MIEAGNTPSSERLPFQAMTQGPFAALLRVPEEGFSWREGLLSIESDPVGKKVTGSWLVRQDSLYSRQYSPLAIPNLHRRFAKIEPTAESILAFANEYGFLGHAQWLADPSLKHQTMLVGEPLGFWQYEIERLALLIELWGLVKRGDRRELGHLVEWTPWGQPRQVKFYLVGVGKMLRPDLTRNLRHNLSGFHSDVRQAGDRTGQNIHRLGTVLADEENGIYPELLERWKHGDSIEPSRYFVHREVNNRLRGHVSPAVLPLREGEIFFFPDCLLTSLYTLFMLELSGRSRPAMLCERPGCGRYFQPEHGRQQYCEKRCQQLAYYYRKKEKERTN